MKDLLIITGPTAVGKSGFAVECAKIIDGEIISCDSMQIYKDLNIGTAKITEEEKSNIPHYMLDIVEASEEYSVAEYQKKALSLIKDIKSRNKVPIIVGGTGLYINSILYPMTFAKRNEEIRKNLKAELDNCGKEYMYQKLKVLDYDSYNRLHLNDTKRVLRAIEIALLGDKQASEETNKARFDALIIVLNADRKILYDRINQRVEQMINSGLVDETAQVLKKCGYQSFQAIGYKEIAEYVKGKGSLADAVELLKRSTRNYAKRQLTWFRQYKDAFWFDYNDKASAQKLVEDTFTNDHK